MNKNTILQYLPVYMITYAFFHVGIEQLPIVYQYDME